MAAVFQAVLAFFLTLFQVFILDIPFVISLAVLMTINTTLWCYETYLEPQIENLRWTEDRSLGESTYYRRYCDLKDQTTFDANDLIEVNGDPEEAYRTFLRHGYVGLPGILPPELAHDLRQYILRRNYESDPEGVLHNGLHMPENRWLLTLAADDDPLIAQTLEVVGRNRLLQESLRHIMGDSTSLASLIEFDVITSTVGAEAQTLHSDGEPELSPLLAARSFFPTHVLLTQLQDTTIGMGSTEVCPGTHYCDRGPVEKVCEEEGLIPIVNHDGIWPRGMSVLMNTNSYHRGGEYTGEGISKEEWERHPVTGEMGPPHRVMIVMTFAPIPLKRAESRMLTHGLSYSLPWYQWGHTLEDMAEASTRMVHPIWAPLRALGLHHKFLKTRKGIDATNATEMTVAKNYTAGRARDGTFSEWGVDFVSLWLRRAANEYEPIDDAATVQLFVAEDKNGWPYRWIHGATAVPKVRSWLDLGLLTLRKLETLSIWGAGVLVLSSLLFVFVYNRSTQSSDQPSRSATRALVGVVFRLMVRITLFGSISFQVRKAFDASDWAHDLSHGFRNIPHFDARDTKNPSLLPFESGKMTIPVRDDILIDTRLSSSYLALYQDFIKYGHPGTVEWKDVCSRSVYFMGRLSSETIARSIVRQFESMGARFLHQSHSQGTWHILSYTHSVQQTHQELIFQRYPALETVSRHLPHIVCRYGIYRKTALCDHATGTVAAIRRSLLKAHGVLDPIEEKSLKVDSGFITPSSRALLRSPSFSKQLSLSRERRGNQTIPFRPQRPEIVEGDLVIAPIGHEWFMGEVISVFPTALVYVRFLDDGDKRLVRYDDALMAKAVMKPGRAILVRKHDVSLDREEDNDEDDEDADEKWAEAERRKWADGVIVQVNWKSMTFIYEYEISDEHDEDGFALHEVPMDEVWRVNVAPHIELTRESIDEEDEGDEETDDE